MIPTALEPEDGALAVVSCSTLPPGSLPALGHMRAWSPCAWAVCWSAPPSRPHPAPPRDPPPPPPLQHTILVFNGTVASGKAAALNLHVKLLGDPRPFFSGAAVTGIPLMPSTHGGKPWNPNPSNLDPFGPVHFESISHPYLVRFRCGARQLETVRLRAGQQSAPALEERMHGMATHA